MNAAESGGGLRDYRFDRLRNQESSAQIAV
jgi:hypothetical protein